MKKDISSATINKILIICLNGMGDVITATPLIQSVRQTYPRAHIILLLQNQFMRNVFGNLRMVDEFMFFDVKSGGVMEGVALVIKLISKKIDLSFTVTDTDLVKGPLMTFLVGIKYRVGEVSGARISFFGKLYNYPIIKDYRKHRIESNLDLFRRISSAELISRPIFVLEKSHESELNIFTVNHGLKRKKYVVIHPGCKADESWRRWPIEHYLAVARRITGQHQLPVIFIGGKDELELFPLIEKQTDNFIINAIDKLTIGASAALIRDAFFIIGNDSGLMHIAGVVNTPTVNLMAYVPPNRCAPRGCINEIIEPRDLIAGNNKIQSISETQVLDAVDRLIRRIK